MEVKGLTDLPDQLLSKWASEIVEFKEASKDYSTDEIGQCLSALSNEANLRNVERAWLVFGVRNKTRTVGREQLPIGA